MFATNFFSRHSDLQLIQVLDSYEFGRVLVLDGVIMLTEKDEFIYHEMLVHVPMGVNPNVKRALIIEEYGGHSENSVVTPAWRKSSLLSLIRWWLVSQGVLPTTPCLLVTRA